MTIVIPSVGIGTTAPAANKSAAAAAAFIRDTCLIADLLSMNCEVAVCLSFV